MQGIVSRLLGGRLQIILIASFSLVAVLTVGLNTVAISRVIQDYLSFAEAERVDRDMDLAEAFYQLKLDEIAAISYRLALDPLVVGNHSTASQGEYQAVQVIDQQITNKIMVLALGGTHLIAVLDADGNLIVGRVLSSDGELSTVLTDGNLSELPLVADVLDSGQPKAATEILPADLLSQVGLEDQAFVQLIDTPKAATNPYDPREGTAGLALAGVYPLKNENDQVIGAVVAVYLFNNDFTLVDRIKEVAGVDTVTIFFGDLRVSTNVMTEARERAVGTRVSQEVFDVVLKGGEDYVGEAFVVNQVYITRYTPLHDHDGRVVGILYVGVLKSSFQALVDAFRNRVIVIALVCMVLAGLVAIPIASLITRPIVNLVEANRRLAEGDMTVRVQSDGNGELAMLGRSFNYMVQTLQSTQQELLQKEKLASMGQLAAGVAHEINNPLGSILLFADMMYKETSSDDPHHEDLKMIIDETTRCKVIVSDLLNFARQQDVVTQPTEIHALMEQVIENVSLNPVFEYVQFVRQYDQDIPVICADPAQLQQVFINLFNNAAEAMEGKGEIRITTNKPDDECVVIQISDTGSGIPEEYLGKIFTPFFTTKALGKGTGLGLSIVYGIIKMHRGQISVKSRPGEGTTFMITLPIQPFEPQMRQGNQNGDLIG